MVNYILETGPKKHYAYFRQLAVLDTDSRLNNEQLYACEPQDGGMRLHWAFVNQ